MKLLSKMRAGVPHIQLQVLALDIFSLGELLGKVKDFLGFGDDFETLYFFGGMKFFFDFGQTFRLMTLGATEIDDDIFGLLNCFLDCVFDE